MGIRENGLSVGPSVAGMEHEHEKDGPFVTGESDEVAHDAHAPTGRERGFKGGGCSQRFPVGAESPSPGVSECHGHPEVLPRADKSGGRRTVFDVQGASPCWTPLSPGAA